MEIPRWIAGGQGGFSASRKRNNFDARQPYFGTETFVPFCSLKSS